MSDDEPKVNLEFSAEDYLYALKQSAAKVMSAVEDRKMEILREVEAHIKRRVPLKITEEMRTLGLEWAIRQRLMQADAMLKLHNFIVGDEEESEEEPMPPGF